MYRFFCVCPNLAAVHGEAAMMIPSSGCFPLVAVCIHRLRYAFWRAFRFKFIILNFVGPKSFSPTLAASAYPCIEPKTGSLYGWRYDSIAAPPKSKNAARRFLTISGWSGVAQGTISWPCSANASLTRPSARSTGGWQVIRPSSIPTSPKRSFRPLGWTTFSLHGIGRHLWSRFHTLTFSDRRCFEYSWIDLRDRDIGPLTDRMNSWPGIPDLVPYVGKRPKLGFKPYKWHQALGIRMLPPIWSSLQLSV